MQAMAQNIKNSQINDLKNLYKEQKYLPKLINDEDIPHQQLDKNFADIKLIEVSGTQGQKDLIDIRNIFQRNKNKSNSSDPKKILIKGGAGSGKSTIFTYIGYQWGKNNIFTNFDFLVKIRLLKLTSVTQSQFGSKSQEEQIIKLIQMSLNDELELLKYQIESKIISSEQSKVHSKIEVIDNQKINFFDKKRQFISSIIQLYKKSKSILFLLDGYDQISHLYTNIPTGKHLVKKLIDFLLNKNNISILMTSRPNGIKPQLQNQFQKIFEVKSLAYDSIKNYIANFFLDVYIGKQLERNLNDNSSLKNLVRTPINLALICFIYNKKKKRSINETNQRYKQTFSLCSLYDEVILWLTQRFFTIKQSKQNATNAHRSNEIRQAFEPFHTVRQLFILKQLAYQKFKQESQQIDQLEIFDIIRRSAQYSIEAYQVQQFGLLKLTGKTENTKIRKNPYSIHKQTDIKLFSFIHLSFQQYLTAIKLKQLLQSSDTHQKRQATKFIGYHRYSLRYVNVYKFLAGMVNTSNIAIKPFWEAISCNIDGIIQIGKENKVKFLMYLLSESIQNKQIPKQIPNHKQLSELICETIFSESKQYQVGEISQWSKYILKSGYFENNMIKKVKQNSINIKQNLHNKRFNMSEAEYRRKKEMQQQCFMIICTMIQKFKQTYEDDKLMNQKTSDLSKQQKQQYFVKNLVNQLYKNTKSDDIQTSALGFKYLNILVEQLNELYLFQQIKTKIINANNYSDINNQELQSNMLQLILNIFKKTENYKLMDFLYQSFLIRFQIVLKSQGILTKLDLLNNNLNYLRDILQSKKKKEKLEVKDSCDDILIKIGQHLIFYKKKSKNQNIYKITQYIVNLVWQLNYSSLSTSDSFVKKIQSYMMILKSNESSKQMENKKLNELHQMVKKINKQETKSNQIMLNKNQKVNNWIKQLTNFFYQYEDKYKILEIIIIIKKLSSQDKTINSRTSSIHYQQLFTQFKQKAINFIKKLQRIQQVQSKLENLEIDAESTIKNYIQIAKSIIQGVVINFIQIKQKKNDLPKNFNFKEFCRNSQQILKQCQIICVNLILSYFKISQSYIFVREILLNLNHSKLQMGIIGQIINYIIQKMNNQSCIQSINLLKLLNYIKNQFKLSLMKEARLHRESKLNLQKKNSQENQNQNNDQYQKQNKNHKKASRNMRNKHYQQQNNQSIYHDQLKKQQLNTQEIVNSFFQSARSYDQLISRLIECKRQKEQIYFFIENQESKQDKQFQNPIRKKNKKRLKNNTQLNQNIKEYQINDKNQQQIQQTDFRQQEIQNNEQTNKNIQQSFNSKHTHISEFTPQPGNQSIKNYQIGLEQVEKQKQIKLLNIKKRVIRKNIQSNEQSEQSSEPQIIIPRNQQKAQKRLLYNELLNHFKESSLQFCFIQKLYFLDNSKFVFNLNKLTSNAFDSKSQSKQNREKMQQLILYILLILKDIISVQNCVKCISQIKKTQILPQVNKKVRYTKLKKPDSQQYITQQILFQQAYVNIFKNLMGNKYGNSNAKIKQLTFEIIEQLVNKEKNKDAKKLLKVNILKQMESSISSIIKKKYFSKWNNEVDQFVQMQYQVRVDKNEQRYWGPLIFGDIRKKFQNQSSNSKIEGLRMLDQYLQNYNNYEQVPQLMGTIISAYSQINDEKKQKFQIILCSLCQKYPSIINQVVFKNLIQMLIRRDKQQEVIQKIQQIFHKSLRRKVSFLSEYMFLLIQEKVTYQSKFITNNGYKKLIILWCKILMENWHFTNQSDFKKLKMFLKDTNRIIDIHIKYQLLRLLKVKIQKINQHLQQFQTHKDLNKQRHRHQKQNKKISDVYYSSVKKQTIQLLFYVLNKNQDYQVRIMCLELYHIIVKSQNHLCTYQHIQFIYPKISTITDYFVSNCTQGKEQIKQQKIKNSISRVLIHSDSSISNQLRVDQQLKLNKQKQQNQLKKIKQYQQQKIIYQMLSSADSSNLFIEMLKALHSIKRYLNIEFKQQDFKFYKAIAQYFQQMLGQKSNKHQNIRKNCVKLCIQSLKLLGIIIKQINGSQINKNPNLSLETLNLLNHLLNRHEIKDDKDTDSIQLKRKGNKIFRYILQNRGINISKIQQNVKQIRQQINKINKTLDKDSKSAQPLKLLQTQLSQTLILCGYQLNGMLNKNSFDELVLDAFKKNPITKEDILKNSKQTAQQFQQNNKKINSMMTLSKIFASYHPNKAISRILQFRIKFAQMSQLIISQINIAKDLWSGLRIVFSRQPQYFRLNDISNIYSLSDNCSPQLQIQILKFYKVAIKKIFCFDQWNMNQEVLKQCLMSIQPQKIRKRFVSEFQKKLNIKKQDLIDKQQSKGKLQDSKGQIQPKPYIFEVFSAQLLAISTLSIIRSFKSKQSRLVLQALSIVGDIINVYSYSIKQIILQKVIHFLIFDPGFKIKLRSTLNCFQKNSSLLNWKLYEQILQKVFIIIENIIQFYSKQSNSKLNIINEQIIYSLLNLIGTYDDDSNYLQTSDDEEQQSDSSEQDEEGQIYEKIYNLEQQNKLKCCQILEKISFQHPMKFINENNKLLQQIVNLFDRKNKQTRMYALTCYCNLIQHINYSFMHANMSKIFKLLNDQHQTVRARCLKMLPNFYKFKLKSCIYQDIQTQQNVNTIFKALNDPYKSVCQEATICIKKIIQLKFYRDPTKPNKFYKKLKKDLLAKKQRNIIKEKYQNFDIITRIRIYECLNPQIIIFNSKQKQILLQMLFDQNIFIRKLIIKIIRKQIEIEDSIQLEQKIIQLINDSNTDIQYQTLLTLQSLFENNLIKKRIQCLHMTVKLLINKEEFIRMKVYAFLQKLIKIKITALSKENIQWQKQMQCIFKGVSIIIKSNDKEMENNKKGSSKELFQIFALLLTNCFSLFENQFREMAMQNILSSQSTQNIQSSTQQYIKHSDIVNLANSKLIELDFLQNIIINRLQRGQNLNIKCQTLPSLFVLIKQKPQSKRLKMVIKNLLQKELPNITKQLLDNSYVLEDIQQDQTSLHYSLRMIGLNFYNVIQRHQNELKIKIVTAQIKCFIKEKNQANSKHQSLHKNDQFSNSIDCHHYLVRNYLQQICSKTLKDKSLSYQEAEFLSSCIEVNINIGITRERDIIVRGQLQKVQQGKQYVELLVEKAYPKFSLENNSLKYNKTLSDPQNEKKSALQIYNNQLQTHQPLFVNSGQFLFIAACDKDDIQSIIINKNAKCHRKDKIININQVLFSLFYTNTRKKKFCVVQKRNCFGDYVIYKITNTCLPIQSCHPQNRTRQFRQRIFGKLDLQDIGVSYKVQSYKIDESFEQKIKKTISQITKKRKYDLVQTIKYNAVDDIYHLLKKQMSPVYSSAQVHQSQLLGLNEMSMEALYLGLKKVNKRVDFHQQVLEKTGLISRYQTEKELAILFQKNPNYRTYYKVFYWTLKNYFDAFRNSSTNMYKNNQQFGKSSTVQFVQFFAKKLSGIISEVGKTLPLFGAVFSQFDKFIQFLCRQYHQFDFSNKMNAINNFIKEFFLMDAQIELALMMTTLELMKVKKSVIQDPQDDQEQDQVAGLMKFFLDKVQGGRKAIEEGSSQQKKIPRFGDGDPVANMSLKDVGLLLSYIYAHSQDLKSKWSKKPNQKSATKPVHMLLKDCYIKSYQTQRKRIRQSNKKYKVATTIGNIVKEVAEGLE